MASVSCLSGATTRRSPRPRGMPCRPSRACTLAQRDVVCLCEPADLPVPDVALVLSDVHLDALSLPGVAHRLEPGPTIRSGRRSGISCQHGLRFAPLAVAHGALLAGMIANRIFYLGAALPDFKVGSPSSSSFYWVWCSARCWCLRRSWLRRSGRAIANMHLAQRYVANSMPSGCAVAPLPMSLWWVAATSNPSPIWAIV